jgi:outer membrane protein OmpA-like peptidoglycan-associated protein
MRTPAALLLALALALPVAARADDPPQAAPAAPARDKLQVTIDRDKVDLAGHKLEVKLSRAAEKVRLKVLGASGAVLAELEKPFQGAAAGTALVVEWTPSSDEVVARIEVWGHDTEGYYAGVAITPWSVSIPHEEVNFESGSDVIRASEAPKLEASLKLVKEAVQKHKDLGSITLFVVGHTDTVGTADYNFTLSLRRARAIATWFRGHGVAIAVAYEGLGESSPLVKTGDEVDEPKNRRVDYILALEPPKLPAAAKPLGWKTL